MGPNEVRINVDGTTLRAFMTLLKRRNDGSKRDAV